MPLGGVVPGEAWRFAEACQHPVAALEVGRLSWLLPVRVSMPSTKKPKKRAPTVLRTLFAMMAYDRAELGRCKLEP